MTNIYHETNAYRLKYKQPIFLSKKMVGSNINDHYLPITK